MRGQYPDHVITLSQSEASISVSSSVTCGDKHRMFTPRSGKTPGYFKLINQMIRTVPGLINRMIRTVPECRLEVGPGVLALLLLGNQLQELVELERVVNIVLRYLADILKQKFLWQKVKLFL